MKKLQIACVVLAVLVITEWRPSASGLVAVYGAIERVVFEPNDKAPERVQVWGAFALVDGGVDRVNDWTEPRQGYVYFTLPPAGELRAADVELIVREWRDLRSVAGTPQAVGFGRWGYIGRFEELAQGTAAKPAQTYDLVPGRGNHTDLRIRGRGETPTSPATYRTNTGIVRLTAGGSHGQLVKQLLAAVKR